MARVSLFSVAALTLALNLLGHALAQTPTAMLNAGGANTTQMAGLSANSPWVGAQVGYRFPGASEFADDLTVSSSVLYRVRLGTERFEIPVMGTIAPLTQAVSANDEVADSLSAKAEALLMSSSGLSVGVFPFYKLLEHDVLAVTLHGSAAYKLNAAKDSTASTQYLDIFRSGVGIELSLGQRSDGTKPLTLSIVPTISVFKSASYGEIFGVEASSLKSLEMSGVAPVGRGVGVLFEAIAIEEQRPVFRAGLLFETEAS